MFILEIYLIISFLIFFFYGIVSHFSKNKNFSFRFFGTFFLMILIFTNVLMLIYITILNDIPTTISGMSKNAHIISYQNTMMYAFLVIVFYSYRYMSNTLKINYFEYYVIIFISIGSSVALLSTNNFILFYILIEIQSISLYVLTAFSKGSRYGIESSIKYFIMGSISSVLLLLGVTFLYAITGFFSFSDITLYIKLSLMMESSYIIYPVYLFTFTLILISILFKMYSAPFHY